MWNDEVIEAMRIAPPGTVDLGAFDLGQWQVDSVDSRIKAYGAVLGRLKIFRPRRRAEVAREIGRRHGVPGACQLMDDPPAAEGPASRGAESAPIPVTHLVLEACPTTRPGPKSPTVKLNSEAILGERVEVFAYPSAFLAGIARPATGNGSATSGSVPP